MEATRATNLSCMNENPFKLITRRIDSSKIRHNQKRDLEVTVSLIGDMKSQRELSGIRSGAIIYTHDDNGETLFCLGIDTKSGNITDFGGGVKKEETTVEGGLRELDEESQGVFGPLTPVGIKDELIFHCYNMAIMFIEMDVNPDTINTKFETRVKACTDPEVCGIVWLTTQELLESIHGRGNKLYVRVRRLLNKVTTTIADL